MKQETVTISVYEPGDILDISQCNVRLLSKIQVLQDSQRCMVVRAKQRADGQYTYNIITDKAYSMLLKPEEYENAVYINHVDISELFCADEVK